MDVAGIATWFTTHWGDLISVWLQIVGTASIIVKLTPTLKDDDALKWLIKFTGKYVALNRGSTAGEK